VPLAFGQDLAGEYIAAFLIMAAILAAAMLKNGKPQALPLIANAREDSGIPALELGAVFIVVTILFVFLATLLGYSGLTARDLTRADVGNFSETATTFINAQIGYLRIAVAALFINYGLVKRSRIAFIIGVGVAAYILASTGTRWNWLLCLAPLILYGLIKLSWRKVAFISLVFVFMLLLISARRGSGENLSLVSAALWDIPSFQSIWVINNIESDVANVIYFLYGQVLVLIPRVLWPEKPLDEATVSYMIALIGDRFYEGATILPGFLGSAWLYGGYTGVLIFTLVVAFLVLAVQKTINKQDLRKPEYGLIGLVFLGTVLQVRGISVFYYIPALYYLSARPLFNRLGLLRIWSEKNWR